jgi:hypothetical protein
MCKLQAGTRVSIAPYAVKHSVIAVARISTIGCLPSESAQLATSPFVGTLFHFALRRIHASSSNGPRKQTCNGQVAVADESAECRGLVICGFASAARAGRRGLNAGRIELLSRIVKRKVLNSQTHHRALFLPYRAKLWGYAPGGGLRPKNLLLYYINPHPRMCHGCVRPARTYTAEGGLKSEERES